MKLGIDPFLAGLALAIALAWVLPSLGVTLATLHVDELSVALIFFLHGLMLPPEALRAGSLNVRLHLFIQAFTFVVLPLLGWLVAHGAPETLRGGVLFLAALPSTVSSSVALTAVARGNVPAAVFNASLSSLLGVVLTPLWIRLLLGAHDASLPLGQVVTDLALFLLAPLALGQLLRPWLAARALRHKPVVSKLDRASILLLVYVSFCGSVQAGVWRAHGLSAALSAALLAAVLLATVLALSSLAARALGFAVPDRIAAVFCGSKKTLAAGVPMAQLIFGGGPQTALLILPLLAYHTLQLVVCGSLATRWARGGRFLIGQDGAAGSPEASSQHAS